MDTTTETTAIRETFAEYQRHQNDAEPFLNLHTDQAIVVNIAGRRVLGKEALEQAMTAALASRLANVRTELEIEDIQFVRPDVALVSAIKNVHDERAEESAGDTTLPSSGSLTLVLVKDADAWRVGLAQTTPRMSG